MTDQPLEPEEKPEASEPASEAETEAQPQPGPEPTHVSPPPAPAGAAPKHLYRSRDDSVIAGVCGGLGKYLGVDPVLIRIAAVVLVFAGGAGILLYGIGWIVIPEEPEAGVVPSTVPSTAPAGEPERTSGAVLLGLVFVVLGLFFLLDELWPDFLSWRYTWPIALIAVGVAIVVRGRR